MAGYYLSPDDEKAALILQEESISDTESQRQGLEHDEQEPPEHPHHRSSQRQYSIMKRAVQSFLTALLVIAWCMVAFGITSMAVGSYNQPCNKAHHRHAPVPGMPGLSRGGQNNVPPYAIVPPADDSSKTNENSDQHDKDDSDASSSAFSRLLEAVSTDSLHDLLHEYFPDTYKHGVYQSEKSALEAIHRADAALATSIAQLARRDNTSITSNTPQSTPQESTPVPVSSTPVTSDTVPASSTPEASSPTPASGVSASETPNTASDTATAAAESSGADAPTDSAAAVSTDEAGSTVAAGSTAAAPASTVVGGSTTVTGGSTIVADGSTSVSGGSTVVVGGSTVAATQTTRRTTARGTATATSDDDAAATTAADDTSAADGGAATATGRKVTSTFTSTINGTPTVVTATYVVGVAGVSGTVAASTSSTAAGTLQTGGVAALRGSNNVRFVEAVAGVVVVGVMLA